MSCDLYSSPITWARGMWSRLQLRKQGSGRWCLPRQERRQEKVPGSAGLFSFPEWWFQTSSHLMEGMCSCGKMHVDHGPHVQGGLRMCPRGCAAHSDYPSSFCLFFCHNCLSVGTLVALLPSGRMTTGGTRWNQRVGFQEDTPGWLPSIFRYQWLLNNSRGSTRMVGVSKIIKLVKPKGRISSGWTPTVVLLSGTVLLF